MQVTISAIGSLSHCFVVASQSAMASFSGGAAMSGAPEGARDLADLLRPWAVHRAKRDQLGANRIYMFIRLAGLGVNNSFT